MSREGGRHADLSTVVETRRGTTTLVLGATSHDAACRRLARTGQGRAYRLRMRTAEPDGVEAASTDETYETAVYDDLALPEAGVAVADTTSNLEHDGVTLDPGQLVVCVDGAPLASTRTERQQLFQFLHAVCQRVADADGHLHVHLPVDSQSRVATVVSPLFEYVVEAADVDASPDA
jgi:hypothetical protein